VEYKIQQVLKAQDVVIKQKWLVIIILLLFLQLSALGQTRDFTLQKSIIKLIHYPDSLRKNCTPTFTNIMIDISAKGELESIYMADSASPDLKNEFIRIKSKLNPALINQFIKDHKLKNCGILIPVFYVFARDYCNNPAELANNLNDNYFTYQSKRYTKLTLNLEPIVLTLYKSVN